MKKKDRMVAIVIDEQATLQWLSSRGRPIDLARVSQSDNPDKIWQTLVTYCNSDGGFGHALEPDIRLPQSSVIATTVALQYLTEINHAPAQQTIVGAIRFIQAHYQPKTKTWPPVPSNVSDAPHAPWWQYKPNDAFSLNPTAEILAYRFRWPELFSIATDRDQRWQSLTEVTLAHIERLETIEMHDALCVDRLFSTPGFPRANFPEAIQHFYTLLEQAIETDASQWQAYCLKPLDVITSPQHPLAATLQSAIDDSLCYLVDQQKPDGSWTPSWTWMGHHNDIWPKIEQDITSLVTTQTLLTLRRFNAM